MQNPVAVLVFVLASLVAAVALATEPAAVEGAMDAAVHDRQDEPQDPSQEESPRPSKAMPSKAGGPGKAPIPGGPMDENALWWNDPKIQEALSLSANQQAMMSAYLGDYRENVPPDWKLETFHETLIQGNWTRAKAENNRISRAAEQSIKMRGQLKIDVLSVLNDDQHKILVDRFPRLIYKPWTRAMGGARAR